jgi:YegS/Rv2252/BmrU family lipid kinase
MPGLVAIINAAGGSFVENETEEKLRGAFEAAGLEAELLLAKSGSEIEQFAQEAGRSDTDLIVAGGGDGTISAVAAEAHRTAKTLGIIPLGTLNNFSKDLGIPQDIEDAIKVIAAGVTQQIDLGEMNGRLFLNNSSIGLYPRIVRKREHQQRLGFGKWQSALWAAMRVFTPKSFVKVGIEVEGKMFVRRVPFVFVGNNRYEMEFFNIGRRSALSDGKLSLYFLHRAGRIGVIVLLLKTIFGTAKQWKEFEEVLSDSVTIQTRRKRIQVAFDGEVTTMQTPLRYRCLPKALKVIVPPPVEEV